MPYCTNCGDKNPEGSTFCNKCGRPMAGGPREPGKEFEDRCEEECSGRSGSSHVVWAAIVILIGLAIIFNFGLRGTHMAPDWLTDFDFCELIWVVIGLVILFIGIKVLSGRR